jgi:hypothetical protein
MVKINARDHFNKSTIKIEIYGALLVRYFCKEMFSRCIKRESLETHLKSLDKNHTQITFLFTEQTSRSTMHLSIKESEINSCFVHKIDLIKEAANVVIPQCCENEYPIQFEIPSKPFKQMIANIHEAKITVLKLEKEGGSEPLKFSYDAVKKSETAMILADPDKIKLKCTLDPSDIFSISIGVKDIKPFSDSSISDTIHIYADQNKPICLMAELDHKKYQKADGTILESPVCRIKVFTEIKRYNNI